MSVAVFYRGYLNAIRRSKGLRICRIVGGSLLHSAGLFGAALFFCGYLAGLYVAAIAIVANTCYMITAAWLLVVGVFERHDVSDHVRRCARPRARFRHASRRTSGARRLLVER